MEVTPLLVYGDNLEECHKFCELLIDNAGSSEFTFLSNEGTSTLPTYVFEHKNSLKIGLRICGRYKDWEQNSRPSIGHEAPDIIVTKLNEKEQEIFSTEFNEAISAGNNAWQRYPRVSQAARKKIPFVYTVPITDAEIYDGELRSFRHPNIIFQIAQLILMAEESTPSLTFYTDSPWYNQALNKGKAASNVFFTDWPQKYSRFVFSIISKSIGIKTHISEEIIRYGLRNMLLSINEFISDFKILEDHSFHENIDDTINVFIDYINNNIEKNRLYDEIDFLNGFKKETVIKKACFYNKTSSTSSKFKDEIQPKIKYKKSRNKKEFENFARFWGIEGIDGDEMTKKEMLSFIKEPENAQKIPLSYCKNNMVGFIYNTSKFTNILKDAYALNEEIDELNDLESLLFLPIAGYVQDTGGPAFSRPDKGLVRLINDVFYERISDNALVILYSELIPSDWKQKLSSAFNETDEYPTNNLFRELSLFSDYVISDKHEELMVIENED